MTITERPSILVYETIEPIDEMQRRFTALGINVLTVVRTEESATGGTLSGDAFVAAAANAEAVMGLSSVILNRAVLEQLPRLKYIIKLGIGYEVIDLEAATDLGILVANTPVEVEIVAVAEHAIALILACMKRLDFYNRDRMKKEWKVDKDVHAQVIAGKTVGIVGYGRIGRAVARRLQGWDVRLVVHDVHDVEPLYDETVVDLETLIRTSDVVSLHASTEMHAPGHLLDAELLSQMKHSAVLVNTARGSLVDQARLMELLANHHVAAAGLDVFSPQPIPAEHPLLDLPTLLATPHAAAWAPEVTTAIQQMGVDNAVTFFAGNLPSSVLNPEARRESPEPLAAD